MTEDTQQPDPTPPPPVVNAPPSASPPRAAPPTVRGALARPRRQAVWPNVIGVIGIIYAIGGILISGWQALTSLFFETFKDMMPPGAGPNPMEAMAQFGPTLALIAGGLMLVAIMLLVGCIGLLMRKPWGATVLMVWAIVKIIATIANSILAAMIQRAVLAGSAQQGTPIPSMAWDFLVIFSLVFNVVLYCGFPIFVLIWLNLAGCKREIASWKLSGHASQV